MKALIFGSGSIACRHSRILAKLGYQTICVSSREIKPRDLYHKNNFLKNVFFMEKFAEKVQATTFHCFAQDVYNLPEAHNVFAQTSLSKCYPYWDKKDLNREVSREPSLAKDGVHYGYDHHKRFAELLREHWNLK